jgi:predicted dehydrogenase
MYRAGLIGCGAISRHHVEALQATAEVDLVALCDIDEARLQQTGAKYGVKTLYRDYGDMFEREHLDLVTICTQAPAHRPAVLAAAQAGVRGIHCEKVIALDLVEADEMVAECERRNVHLAINHHLRFAPGIRRAIELVSAGAVGELLAIRIMDKGGRPAGNSIMDVGTHFFDCTRVLAGDPAWAWAYLAVHDGEGGMRPATAGDIVPSQVAWPRDRDYGLVTGERCLATFGFPRRSEPGTVSHAGIQMTYQTFFQPPEKRWLSGIELVGLEGVLALRSAGDGVLDLYYRQGPWEAGGSFEPVLVGDVARHHVPNARTGEVLSPTAGAFATVLRNLIGAIEGKAVEYSTGRDGRATLEMILSIYEAHRQGATVPLPPANREHPLKRWLADAGR